MPITDRDLVPEPAQGHHRDRDDGLDRGKGPEGSAPGRDETPRGSCRPRKLNDLESVVRLDCVTYSEGTLTVATDLRSTSQETREQAFRRLTQSRMDRLYRLAAVLLSDAAEAEDAVHEAAVNAWTRWSQLRDESRFDPWMERIVVNVCRDRLRQRRRLRALPLTNDVSRRRPTCDRGVARHARAGTRGTRPRSRHRRCAPFLCRPQRARHRRAHR